MPRRPRTDPPACLSMATAGRQRGYKHSHLRPHVCINSTSHAGWHSCWCGYQWGTP